MICLKKGGDTCWAVEGDNRYYQAILEGGPCYIVHPSDMAPALIALGARIEILGARGARVLPIESFFVTPGERLYQENVLDGNEVITRVIVPRPSLASRQIFLKASVRQAYEFALCAVALAAEINDSICRGCRMVLGGVAPRPYRVRAAEAVITRKPLSRANIELAARAALQGAAPMSMNAYKVDLARNLVRRGGLKVSLKSVRIRLLSTL